MNEREWLDGTDPHPMLEFLAEKACDRKLRLLACACCRRIWGLLTDEQTRKKVEVAERYADGRATEEERIAAYLERLRVSEWEATLAAETTAYSDIRSVLPHILADTARAAGM